MKTFNSSTQLIEKRKKEGRPLRFIPDFDFEYSDECKALMKEMDAMYEKQYHLLDLRKGVTDEFINGKISLADCERRRQEYKDEVDRIAVDLNKISDKINELIFPIK